MLQPCKGFPLIYITNILISNLTYQQYGRGGRNGNKAIPIVLYHPIDVNRVAQLICGRPITVKQKDNMMRLLDYQDYLLRP